MINLNKKRIIALGAVFVLSACSVAEYAKPVTELKQGIDASTKAVEAIDKDLTKRTNAAWKAKLRSGKALLATSEGKTDKGECALGAPACSMAVRNLGKDQLRIAFPVKSMMKDALVGMAGLRKYVANLKAIVDAKTASEITTHANAALASAAEIETSVKTALKDKKDGKLQLTPNVVTAYSAPIAATVKWLVTQYVERQKYKALAAATQGAQPVIDDMEKYHETYGLVAAAFKESNHSTIFNDALSAYDKAIDDGLTDGAINQVLAAAATYDDVLKGSSALPLKDFASAHKALNDSLNGDLSLKDAIAAIKTFKSKADDFKKILGDFQKVAKAKAGDK